MRLIDADKFDAILDNIFNHLYESGRTDLAGTLSAFMEMVKKQPTIDAVPVVRCMDCKHLRESLHRKGETTCPMWGAVGLNPWGFCNLGERKDGDSDA